MSFSRLYLGIGETGRRIMYALASTLPDGSAERIGANIPQLAAPPEPGEREHALAALGGRAVMRAWYLGRVAYEQGQKPTLPGADVVLTALDAASGVGAGAGPALFADACAAAPRDAFRAAIAVLPRAARPGLQEAQNAAYALGSLAEAGAGAILLVDPDHVDALREADPDPFRLAAASARDAATETALASALAVLLRLPETGWQARDIAAALSAGPGRAAFVVPAYLRVREADLDHVNLTGWLLSCLEGSALAASSLEDAEALLAVFRVPRAWSGRPGMRGAEEIAAVLKQVAPLVRVDVDVTVTAAEEAEVAAFLVTRAAPKVREIALSGAAGLLDAAFASTVAEGLAGVEGGSTALARTYSGACERAVRRLGALVREA